MDQDIIEKKPSSPLATSLLAISAACMVACIVFVGMELKGLKFGNSDNWVTKSASAYVKKETKAYNELVKNTPAVVGVSEDEED